MFKYITKILFFIFFFNFFIKSFALNDITIEKKYTNLFTTNYNEKVNLNVISPNGLLLGGDIEKLDSIIKKPIIWYGENFLKLKILEPPFKKELNFPYYRSTVNYFSYRGEVICGNSFTIKGNKGTVWYGDKWNKKKYLKSHIINNWGTSKILAMSYNGKIIGGTASLGKVKHATIWYGDEWEKKIDLGKDVDISLENSQINALSSTGAIAGGFIHQESKKIATIWYGNKWNKRFSIGDVNKGQSSINCISDDGKIAAGFSETLKGKHAYVWFGNKWEKQIDLGSLKENNLGNSSINTLSDLKLILGGNSETNQFKQHAVIWYGTNWIKKLDLGTLKDNNKGFSNLLSMSKDGTLILGEAESDTGIHSVLWHLIYKRNVPNLSFILDKDNLIKSIDLINYDNLLLTKFNYLILKNLQTEYLPLNVKNINILSTYFLNNNIINQLNFNKKINKNLITGFSFLKLKSNFISSTHYITNNIGLGGYIYLYNQPKVKNFYLKSSAALYLNDLNIKRPELSDSDFSHGNTNTKNKIFSLKIGKKKFFYNKYIIDIFTEINKFDFIKSKYIEKDFLFPLFYKDIKNNFFSFKIGFNFYKNFFYNNKIYLEKFVYKKQPFIVNSYYLNYSKINDKEFKNRLKSSHNFEFTINNNLKISNQININFFNIENIIYELKISFINRF